MPEDITQNIQAGGVRRLMVRLDPKSPGETDLLELERTAEREELPKATLEGLTGFLGANVRHDIQTTTIGIFTVLGKRNPGLVTPILEEAAKKSDRDTIVGYNVRRILLGIGKPETLPPDEVKPPAPGELSMERISRPRIREKPR